MRPKQLFTLRRPGTVCFGYAALDRLFITRNSWANLSRGEEDLSEQQQAKEARAATVLSRARRKFS